MTASRDTTTKVWDAQTGQELVTLTGHDSRCIESEWKRITTGAMGVVQTYTTGMEELLQIAESRVTRQLTAEEKDKYGVLDWESTTYTYRYPRNR